MYINAGGPGKLQGRMVGEWKIGRVEGWGWRRGDLAPYDDQGIAAVRPEVGPTILLRLAKRVTQKKDGPEAHSYLFISFFLLWFRLEDGQRLRS